MKQENDELKTENNRLQHKLKEMYEEYRNKLSKYVQDVAQNVDDLQTRAQQEEMGGFGERDELLLANATAPGTRKLTQYVLRMLNEIKHVCPVERRIFTILCCGFLCSPQ